MGEQGHVAYPHRADNPIHRFAPALRALIETRWDEGSRDFEPTSLQFSTVHAGTGADNVIPGVLEARFSLRYSDLVTRSALIRRVEGILTDLGLDYRLDWYASGEPFITRGGRLLESVQAAITEVAGKAARGRMGVSWRPLVPRWWSWDFARRPSTRWTNA